MSMFFLRVAFIKAKLFTFLNNYVLLLIKIFFRKLILKCGCIVILKKDKNTYELNMCGKLINKNYFDVINYFKESFDNLRKKRIPLKRGVNTIYINTHYQFVRGILKLLSEGHDYNKNNFINDVKRGYSLICGHKVCISYQGERLNKMLASAYPLWPTKEKLLEFEERNKPVEFYTLEIPAVLFFD